MSSTISEREQSRRRQARHKARPRAVSRALKQRQEHLLVRTAEGVPRTEIAAELGCKDNTFDQWFRRDPELKARYIHAKAKARGEFVAEEIPFDAGFRQRFFHYPTPGHLQKLIDVINEQVTIAEKEESRDRRILILLPPEHGKSTLLEEYVTYRIAMDPSFRCSIVCATQGQARKRLGAIARMLTDRSAYADLIDSYGPFRSESHFDAKPWTADHFTHLYAPAAQRDYTCQALGWTGSIYGDRMDLIVGDDVADLKNQTPAEIEKQWEKLWGEFRSRIRKGGLFVIIGTHMREDDIYSVMEKKGFFTEVIKMQAIAREPGTQGDEDPGEALWEDNVTMRELLKLRETDRRMFELMYQQNPLPSIGAVFTQEMIESRYNPDRYIGHIPERCFVVAGIDPSVVNYTAGVVFAVSRKGTRYLVDAWAEKGLTGEGGDLQAGVVEFIVELCAKYRVNTLAVENNSWAPLINNSITLRNKLYDLNVRHLPVAIGPASGQREDVVIPQLSGLFTQGLIDLPGSPSSIAHLAEFRHQLLSWTGGKMHWRKKQDLVKAFRLCEHAAKTMLTQQANIASIPDPSAPGYLVDNTPPAYLNDLVSANG